MSELVASSPRRGESGPQEPCYKCNGEAGQFEMEGPHQVWMPCYRCGNTGRLPIGSAAAEVASRCVDCNGAGGEDYRHPEDPGCDGWRNCRTCRGSGRRPEDVDHV